MTSSAADHKEILHRFTVDDATYDPGDEQLGACECALTATRLVVHASTGRLLDLPVLDIVQLKPRTRPFARKRLALSTTYSRLTFSWESAEPVYVIGQLIMDLAEPLRAEAWGLADRNPRSAD